MTRFDKHIPPIIGALVVAAAPHVFHLPPWIVMGSLALWGYAFLGSRKNWILPRQIFLIPLALIAFGLAAATFRGAFHNDTYVGLLTLMSGLKPLEIRSMRHKMITVFLAYFLIITNLFYSDELIMTLYMLASVLITTTVLIHINHPGGRAWGKLRLAGVIMLQAVPVMMVLFFLFPRIQGGLLGLTRQSASTSGFSDFMSPGSFSTLVENDEIAFRAQFQGPVPDPEFRYWRGIVFFYFDGKNWHREKDLMLQREAAPGTQAVSYTITLEPHRDKWLFALDLPGTIPAPGLMLSDYTLIARRSVDSRILYPMTSHLSYNTGPMYNWERICLKLPPAGNPRSRELAGTWQRENASPEDIVAAGLRFLSENNFVYTLDPPLLGRDPIDDFLFNTRKGYCEHYASAFVFLMRAANIPARVVGGYLGGEFNPYGSYLIIRQSDAHAWAEVWLPNKGWTRVDPTGAVSPERIQRGMREALSAEDFSKLFGGLAGLSDLFTYVRLGWDSVNSYWTIWIMGYTQQDQQNLLSRFGIRPGSWKTYLQAILLALALIALLIGGFSVWIFRRRSGQTDEPRRIYDRFCRKLGKIGIPRNPGQGPLDYAAAVSAVRKDLASEVNAITEMYISLRYARDEDEELKNFKTRVRRFAPKGRPGGI
jgi:transglutaminase-like putative cysteine protease